MAQHRARVFLEEIKDTYSSLSNNCAAKPYSFLRIFHPTRPYSILQVYQILEKLLPTHLFHPTRLFIFGKNSYQHICHLFYPTSLLIFNFSIWPMSLENH